MKEGKKSVQKLAETIHSLLGMKDHLTPGWVDSVCDIAKRLNSTGSPARLKYEEHEAEERSFSSVDKIDNSLIISKIKDDIEILRARINELSLRRRQVLNEYLDLKGNIRVFCRMRPAAIGENLGVTRPIVAPDSSKIFLQVLGSTLNSRSYSFDRVFQMGSSQDEVFMEVEPITKSALDGYNACIFAYGQTGTGKTFTMEGNPDNPGVVPRTIQALFKQASTSNHKYLFSFSMLEIYLGNLKDLLVPHPVKPSDPMAPNLTIQTDPSGGIDIENLVAIPVSDHNQALQLYRLGCRFRSIASTNSNLNSSRSHCLIRISITCPGAPERRREKNKVWLIDLGGSERVMKTKASGRRLDEGKAINLSLSALADVIYALQMKKDHIPYRNTKLTQVLKDSLGEDSKTLMLVHVSPKEEDLCETICTLNFAARVRSIHLGKEGPTEKWQKEAAMGNLQAMIAGIERERQDLRDEMEDLLGKLRSLSGTDPSCCEYEYLTPEAPKGNPDITQNKTKDGSAASSSKLPGFMRPTVCSQKKTGKDQQTFDEKQLFPTRKRSAPSNRAKSVAFPMKTGSEYTSDCSISGASCMLDLNLKNSETECSIDTCECDIKTVIFSEEKKASTCYKLVNKYSKQHQKVDKWLKSHDGRSAAGVSRNRLVPAAAPLPMKQKGNEPSRAEALQTAKYFKTTEIDKYSGEVILDEVASTISTVEVEIDVAQVRPSDEDQVIDMDDCFDDYHPDTGDDPVQNTIYSRQNDWKTEQPEEFHTSESSLTSESCHQEVVFKVQMKDKQDNEFELERRTKVLDSKSLYTNHENQNNTNTGTWNVQSSTKTRSAGSFHLLREKIQIICGGALLGLQLQSLGFGDEFFSGLMQ